MWSFTGKRSDHYRQVGNAVPPRLAFAIADCLKQHIELSQGQAAQLGSHVVLTPLNAKLRSAVEYTMKDEQRNGSSRRAAGNKRAQRGARV